MEQDSEIYEVKKGDIIKIPLAKQCSVYYHGLQEINENHGTCTYSYVVYLRGRILTRDIKIKPGENSSTIESFVDSESKIHKIHFLDFNDERILFRYLGRW